MNLTIHTYGHIDAMFYILNGIAMIMNSIFADMMIKAIAFISTCYYGFKVAYAGSSGNSKQNLAKIGAMIIVINSLLIPKTTISIEDHITKQRDKVDNLPFGFAIPVGLMEEFGNILTAAFEQSFRALGSSNYRDYGMVFGARLLQEARNWRIKTPEFVHNMDNFIRRCIIKDVSIGHKYTINDLFESDDVWKLISSKASPLRRIEVKIGNNNALLSCKETVETILNPAFVTEIDKLKSKYKKTEYSLAGNISEIFIPRGTFNANNLFKQNIELVFGSYLGNKISAESSLRQYMMLNSLFDYSRTYGYARSSMAQDTNWQITGDLASTYLPILLSVIKGLVYASFIFITPLMILGGGGAKYISYIAVVASLQLWPALNAILNMFIDLYSANLLQDIAGGGISFTSYSRVNNYSDKIVAVASGLQMIVPFLAFNIVQGGVAGFIHLASNITGASISAASSISHEVVSGNKSFDNYSSGNMQVAMNQGFKTDWNQSYKSASNETQYSDGNIERTLPNGKVINIAGSGITESAGANKIMLNEEISSQLNDSYSNNIEYRKGLEIHRTESQKSLNTMLNQYAEAVNNHQSMGNKLNYDSLGIIESEVREALSHSKNLGTNYEYSDKTSNLWQAGAGFNLGIENLFKSRFGASGNLSGKAEFVTDSSNIQSLNEHSSDVSQIDWNKDQKILLQAAQNEEFNKSSGVSKDLIKNINYTSEEIQLLDKNISHSIAQGEHIQNQISYSKHMNSSYINDITGAVKEYLVEKYSFSSLEADELINNPAQNSASDRIKLQSAKNEIAKKYIPNSRKHHLNIPNEIEKQYSRLQTDKTEQIGDFYNIKNKELEKYNSDSKKKVIQTAEDHGIKEENILEDIEIVQLGLELSHQEIHNKALKATNKALEKNTINMQKTQNELNQVDDIKFFGKKKPYR